MIKTFGSSFTLVDLIGFPVQWIVTITKILDSITPYNQNNSHFFQGYPVISPYFDGWNRY
jgi:hypothetical protein